MLKTESDTSLDFPFLASNALEDVGSILNYITVSILSTLTDRQGELKYEWKKI